MSSGHESGPEDPQGASAPDDASSQDDQDLEWTAWRQGPGYSRPVPPEPEAGSGVPRPGSHEKPGPRHPYQDRVPNQPSSSERREDFWGPKHPTGVSSYTSPEVHEEPRPAPFGQPYDNRPDDADSGPRSQDEKDEYARFWDEGRRGAGGGAHASPSGPAKPPVTPVPPPPGDTSIYRNPPPRRRIGFLIAVAAIIVVAAIVATFLLTRHSPKHPAASGSGSPSAGASSPHSPSPPPASTPPSLTGASGHLGVPGAIGSLRLNLALTSKFVGSSVKKQDANSFFIPDRDVVSGFYTTNPTATSYSASEPRLMFLVAYLSGAGNAHSALHEFMANHTFTGQQQINPGPKGGVAACGLLPQQHAAPVAHCMWADGNTYADFYAWNSSPSALARTMIGIRPKVELSR
jgi:hypothetical protein